MLYYLLETIPLTMLAMAFFRLDLKPAPILVTAATQSLFLFVLKRLHTYFGAHTFILIFTLAFMIYLYRRENLIRAFAAAFFSMLILGFFDLTTLFLANSLWPQLFGHKDYSSSINFLRTAPYEVIMAAVAIYIDKVNKKGSYK
jgi:hypothetical protein